MRIAGDGPVNPNGRYVLYWMTANRRAGWNFSLDRAVDWAAELCKPLVVFEALRCGYGWACDRFHHFIMQGMKDNARAFSGQGVFYYPYLEPFPDADKGLLAALTRDACVVVTDDFPAFFLPRMIAAASKEMPVRLEAVDSNGLLPMRAADRVFPSAHAFRRFLQKTLPDHLPGKPRAEPMKGAGLPRLASLHQGIVDTWPPASASLLEGGPEKLTGFPIDHGVQVVDGEGGSQRGRNRLRRFIEKGLPWYEEKRNEPEEDVTSGLSPYLHFGHISSHEVFGAVVAAENWFFDRLSHRTDGSRNGWWGMGRSAEAFLDQLITWRELGFNMCRLRDDYDRYESLPGWAQETLKAHEMDERPYTYSLQELDAARTHDPLWNAAQRQLLREGVIHNYLRMLWGKKILQWSHTPRQALKVMIELNNKYALDGRDPNSYSGIFWVLGRYDRAWGPQRPVFGKIRYMSSRNTARKVRVKGYLERYS
jgi:deoxyribodipyrimidine photo-lyase